MRRKVSLSWGSWRALRQDKDSIVIVLRVCMMGSLWFFGFLNPTSHIIPRLVKIVKSFLSIYQLFA
jgi:hypothetical protein